MRARFSPLLAVVALLILVASAGAWPWRVEPQPLLEKNDAIYADAGSPLAWEQSARQLWHLSSGWLTVAAWSKGTFRPLTRDEQPLAAAGLLADPALHLVFFVDQAGYPKALRTTSAATTGQRLGAETVTRLLAVDARRHLLFAYDATARGIRLYTFDAKAKTWSSEVIVTGLGTAEEAGAYDPVNRVLFTSHATADSAIPRHAGAATIGDPTGVGLWQPWPLVATQWTPEGWQAEVITETGVPQQPAVRLTDGRVFYAQRDEPDIARYFQPARGKKPEAFGQETGWTGADTYEDHNQYAIRRPDYPVGWFGGSVVTSWSGNLGTDVTLTGPIAVVPYYVPVWTEIALPARLVRFRAVVNGTQNRLIQHRLWASGEKLRTQSGQQLAGYLYRDVNGVFAARLNPFSYATSSYPQLGPTFDPANPPAHFAALASAGAKYSAFKEDTTVPWAGIDWRWPYEIPQSATTNASAAWVAPHVLAPEELRSKNFGHNYGARVANQTGGRYRAYSGAVTTFAASSHLAVDAGTGASFYTQAASPWLREHLGRVIEQKKLASFGATPLASFGRALEDKYAARAEKVWLVFVY